MTVKSVSFPARRRVAEAFPASSGSIFRSSVFLTGVLAVFPCHQFGVTRLAFEMLALDWADTINGDEPHRHAAFSTAGMGRNAVRRPHKFRRFILD
jgi:hypothetical protein